MSRSRQDRHRWLRDLSYPDRRCAALWDSGLHMPCQRSAHYPYGDRSHIVCWLRHRSIRCDLWPSVSSCWRRHDKYSNQDPFAQIAGWRRERSVRILSWNGYWRFSLRTDQCYIIQILCGIPLYMWPPLPEFLLEKVCLSDGRFPVHFRKYIPQNNIDSADRLSLPAL